MLDLSNLYKINIDLNEETVWVQTGATLGQLYYAIAKKSKVHAFPSGVCFSIGTGGIISGGGIGALMRKFGLAADNVVDARGGGGASFGVILAWKLKLVRIPEKLTVFTIRRKLEGNLNLLQKWENIAHQLPEDLLIRIIIQNAVSSAGNDTKKHVEFSFQAQYVGPVDKLIPLLKQKLTDAPESLLEMSIPTKKSYDKGTSDFVKTPIPESGWER
ncbi:tetrahydrocannabinolic acid synthase-like [Solanum tuberosum]|uniref:tetrahydrocannabinolic acid synthase-like n=1 Tax=Solanum tuberosum TaxID=4113 RepID=UPI00073A03B1|nr:PREDICTED: tetrahydrocannabinolic acid synthase-like [Solanum tuberosum]